MDDPKPRGCLIDIDGTIRAGAGAIPGAPEAIAALRRAGVPLRFVTNTTRMSRAALAQELAALGFEIKREECWTASSAAAAWLRGQGATRIALYLPQAAHEEFSGLMLDADNPEYVVVGDLGEAWSFERLNRAFLALHGGAKLVAIQRNPYWQSSKGLALDAGAFVAALEYATGQTALLIGKPSPEMFLAAAADLGLEPRQLVMVGDDLEADIGGALAAGLQAVAVRTGKLSGASLEDSSIQPTAILDSIADLPRWLNLDHQR
ncbi:MAG TPA: TIGR01458 family HAD-type hydrolase [Acidobacteriota bacterium]